MKNKFYKSKNHFFVYIKVLIIFIIYFCIVCSMNIVNFKLVNANSNNLTLYDNAPKTIIGDSKALFGEGGINEVVLIDLLQKINSKEVIGDKLIDDKITTFTAKDFGKYGNQDSWSQEQQGNAQLVLKLFEDTDNVENNVNSLSQQYWQVVYRSKSTNQDVVTLYMCFPYMSENVQFDDVDGDYTNSSIRALINRAYTTLSSTFTNLDEYVVAPSELPDLWQSSSYQTSYNYLRTKWIYGQSSTGGQGTGEGASGYMDVAGYWGIGNGMDGLNDKWNTWSNQDTSTYNDKLWLPSAFETLHTGYGADENATIGNTGRYYDEEEDITYLSDIANSSTGIDNLSGDNRTGLWELSAYDRGAGDRSWSWLRSSYTLGANYARLIYINGNDSSYAVSTYGGVRVALHLDIKKMADDLLANVIVNEITGDMSTMPNVDNIDANILKTEGAYVLTGNTLEEGSLQIVYDVNPNQYCLTFNIGGVDIVANTNSANGIIPNYCNYSFITNDNQIILTLNNIQQSLTVNGSTVSWGSDTCTTTINVSFNSSTNYGIILYVIQGTLDNYVDMKQIFFNSSTTLNLQLVKNQNYLFLIYKPTNCNLSINNENISSNIYQFYVPYTDVNPTSFLLEISNELTDSNKNNEIIL